MKPNTKSMKPAGTRAVPTLTAASEGLPLAAIDEFMASGAISAAELHALVLPQKDLASRRKPGRLTQEQSERLLRVARIMALADENFGAREIAHRWLRRPNEVLENMTPLNMLDKDLGAQKVEALLLRIAHGVAA